MTRPPPGARELARAPRLPIYDNTLAHSLAPTQKMMPTKAQAQEDMSQATEAQGAPRCFPLSTTLLSTFLTRSRMERDTRRQSFLVAFKGLGLLGPRVNP